MHRAPSILTRAVRAMTALITVWCLGCSSFEPLLSALLGPAAGPAMACDFDSAVGGPAMLVADESRDAQGANTVAAADTTSARGFVCGCQSCHAASPTLFAVEAEPIPTPSLPANSPAVLLSVVRQPLVPPPQSAI